LRWHFVTEHSDFNQKYSGEFRKQKVASLVQALKVQQNILKEYSVSSKQAIKVSFDTSQKVLLKVIL
jgi:hypothetical protein